MQVTAPKLITQKQHDYICALLDARTPNTLAAAILDAPIALADMPRATASGLIDALLDSPFKDTPAAPAPAKIELEPGYYAAPIDGTLGFFKIDRPEYGRWAGWTFVTQYAGENEYPVKGARKEKVISEIAADPTESMLLFGRKIGTCGHCGRTLTDPESRARGIGPVCAGKLGL